MLEKLSESEAIVEVLISKTNESLDGSVDKKKMTKRYLFRGFDLSDRKAGESLAYVGGVLRLTEDWEGLPIIEPARFPPLPKHKAELGVGIRTWEDDTGEHKLRAAFDSIVDDKVVLVTSEGRRVEVPLNRLSIKDRLAVKPPAVPPRRRPKRTAASRDRRRRARSSQNGPSFQEAMKARIMNDVLRDMNYSIQSMNQGFYRAHQTMQRINSQLKSRFGR